MIRTRESELQAADVVRDYKQLTRVGRAFHCRKTVDVLVRPIRYRKEDRAGSPVAMPVGLLRRMAAAAGLCTDAVRRR